MNRNLIHAATALLVTATLAACSGQSNVAGSPTTAPSSAAPSSTHSTSAGVDVAALKPGNYPTAPVPAPVWSLEGAKRMQAQQMADFVVGPWEIDPVLTGQQPNQLFTDATQLKTVLLDNEGIAGKHNFINAFSTRRVDPDNPDHKGLVTMVMRFSTPQDAGAAAAETSAALGAYYKAGSQETAFIPGHPEAHSTQSPQVGGKYQVTSLTSHGPFVLYQEATSTESAEAAAALVGKTLDLQAPRIDGYHPGDPAQNQSLDPTTLISKTLPLQPGQTDQFDVYGSYGALHFSDDPVNAARRYSDAGVDFVSTGLDEVIQTKDAASATTLASKFFDLNSAGQQPGPTVPGLPAAKCLQSPQGEDPGNAPPVNYRCITAMDRWVVLTASQQVADVTQQVAAQYLMLVGK